VQRGERTFLFNFANVANKTKNTTKTTVKLRKVVQAQTKTTTHNYQKEKKAA
jgi:hypothetical protein